jgi:membrane-associated protease RseP (regulator of RpoE activity)
MIWLVPIFLLIVVLVHEFGHFVSAKLQHLSVVKFCFTVKPLPHFYISIIENSITMRQRILFLLGGNLMILLLFAGFLLSGFDNRYIYYILVYQILIDTNPFYSDYVVVITSFLYRKLFRTNYYTRSKKENQELNINEIKERYMFNPIWYIHFILWGILSILLVSPKFLNNYI